MEVSKISFTEETRQKLQSPMLDRKKRQELRRRLALELIKSKPNGSEFSTREFTRACFKEGSATTNTLRFVKQMERDGLIAIEAIPNSYKYIVMSRDATTIVAPKVPKVKPLWKDGEKPATEVVAPAAVFDDIVELAKQFAWEENSNDLREFIKWGKVKAFDQVKSGGGGVLIR